MPCRIIISSLTFGSAISVVLLVTAKQVPPPSSSVRCVNPTPDCTTKSPPSASKAMPLGLVKPFAMRRYSQPLAATGAGYVTLGLLEHTCAAVRRWSSCISKYISNEKSLFIVAMVSRNRNDYQKPLQRMFKECCRIEVTTATVLSESTRYTSTTHLEGTTEGLKDRDIASG